MVEGNHQEAVRTLFTGVCDIYVKEAVHNSITGRSEFSEVCLKKGLPCRLSYKTVPVVSTYLNAPLVSQEIKLFLEPRIQILAGSKIVVTQNGRTETYEKSGEAAVYQNHQEVSLKLLDNWA